MPSRMASGFQVIAEAIARRWQTPNGGLIDDPYYGFDVTDYISAGLTSLELSSISQQARAEALKDERVEDIQVTVSTTVTGTLTVAGVVSTAQAAFKLVLTVNNVTPAVLEVTVL